VSPSRDPSGTAALEQVAEVLDPVLAPLGFAPAQGRCRSKQGQVIFCRGLVDGIDDGCVDLVVDLVATPDWRVNDVRYWGFTSDRWHLNFDPRGNLIDQLQQLALTLPMELA
jgi:hypothetical protein